MSTQFNMSKTAAGLLLGLFAFAGARSNAAVVVAPNAETSASQGNPQYLVFGNGGNLGYVFQAGYAASQFSSIPLGTKITSIGYRLASGEGTLTSEIDYSQFNIQIGKAAEPIGSLSATFAANLGTDTVLARSGPLDIAAGTFIGGGTVNPFYQIPFSTPYTYTGGDLVITIRDTASVEYNFDVDGVAVGSGITDTNAAYGTDSSATNGQSQFYNAPVIELTYGAVPEPASMGIAAVAATAALLRIRRRAASVQV
jgi:hypothetical protein